MNAHQWLELVLFVGALVLVSQGVIQTFASSITVHSLQGATQTIPLGPVAFAVSALWAPDHAPRQIRGRTALALVAAFIPPDGQIIDVCAGRPCRSPG